MNVKKIVLALTLSWVALSGWGQSQTSQPEVISLSAKMGNDIVQIRLGLDLAGNEPYLYPLPQNDVSAGLSIAEKGKPASFSGSIDWIAVGNTVYFRPNQFSALIPAYSPASVGVSASTGIGTDLKGRLETSGVKITVDAVEMRDPAAGSSVSRPLILPKKKLAFSSVKGQSLQIYASDKSNNHRLMTVKIQDWSYWKKTLEFWGVSNPGPSITETIKNTLFLVLLDSDARPFFDADYDSAKFDAIQASLDQSKRDFLSDYARMVYAQVGIDHLEGAETNRVPLAELYSELQSSDSSLARQYFSVLLKKNQASSPSLSQAQGRALAVTALKFLYGPENQLGQIKSLDDKARVRAQLVARHNNIDLDSFSPKTLVASASGQSSSASLTLVKASDARTGVLLNNGDQELVFIPNQVNLANFNTLSTTDGIAPLLWEDETIAETAKTSATLSFKTPQRVAYLTFWANGSFGLTKVNNVTVPAPAVSRFQKVVSEPLKTSLQTTTSKVSGSYQLYLVPLPEAIAKQSNLSLTLSFASGTKIVKMAAYSAGLSYTSYTWFSFENTFQFQSVTSLNISEAQVILATPEPLITFLSRATGSVPSGQTKDSSFSPVRYAFGGWETPLRYSEKVMDNRLEKVFQGLHSQFPFTELDAFPQGKQLNSAGLYSTVPQVSDLKPVYSADASHKTYVYGYGLDLPYQASTLLSDQSPFFTEKLTGVDSLGLVTSGLLAQNVAPTFPGVSSSQVLDRWQVRQGVYPFSQFIPRLNEEYNSPATLGRLTSASVSWYERNSQVVTDWRQTRIGDLLVGYQGRNLEAAIVVSVPPTLTDFDTFTSQVYVVTINKALQAAALVRWNQMANAENYHLRRLVTSPTAATRLMVPQEVTVPQGARIWVPDTGYMAKLGLPNIELQAATGELYFKPIFNPRSAATWTISPGGVIDYGYDSDGKNSSTTKFYLVAYSYETFGNPINGQIVTNPESFPKAQLVASFTSNTQSNALNITWVNQDRLKLVGERASSEGTYLLTVRRLDDNQVFTKLGIVATNPTVGDDIQISFRVNNSVVYRTMPITVYPASELDTQGMLETVKAQNEELRTTILEDSQVSEAKRKAALAANWYFKVLNEDLYVGSNAEHNGFDLRFLNESIISIFFDCFEYLQLGESDVAGFMSRVQDLVAGAVYMRGPVLDESDSDPVKIALNMRFRVAFADFQDLELQDVNASLGPSLDFTAAMGSSGGRFKAVARRAQPLLFANLRSAKISGMANVSKAEIASVRAKFQAAGRDVDDEKIEFLLSYPKTRKILLSSNNIPVQFAEGSGFEHNIHLLANSRNSQFMTGLIQKAGLTSSSLTGYTYYKQVQILLPNSQWMILDGAWVKRTKIGQNEVIHIPLAFESKLSVAAPETGNQKALVFTLKQTPNDGTRLFLRSKTLQDKDATLKQGLGVVIENLIKVVGDGKLKTDITQQVYTFSRMY